MKKNDRTEYVTRDTIMKLLSDDEVARVSTAETAAKLADGDEYVDLEELNQGVRKVLGSATAPMGRVVPRKAVQEKTWLQIVAVLGKPGTVGARLPAN